MAENTATTGGPDAQGDSVTSLGNNLVGEIDGSSGWIDSDLTGTIARPLDPLLAPLGDYGGPTETIALLPGSPAIGAGTAVSGITTDQRGFPLDSPPDIGAFQTITLVVNTTSDGIGSPPGELSLRQAIDLAERPGRQRNDHVRPDRLCHIADDHADAGPARARRHERDGDDRRPGGRRDNQRRRAEPGVPDR